MNLRFSHAFQYGYIAILQVIVIFHKTTLQKIKKFHHHDFNIPSSCIIPPCLALVWVLEDQNHFFVYNANPHYGFPLHFCTPMTADLIRDGI